METLRVLRPPRSKIQAQTDNKEAPKRLWKSLCRASYYNLLGCILITISHPIHRWILIHLGLRSSSVSSSCRRGCNCLPDSQANVLEVSSWKIIATACFFVSRGSLVIFLMLCSSVTLKEKYFWLSVQDMLYTSVLKRNDLLPPYPVDSCTPF